MLGELTSKVVGLLRRWLYWANRHRLLVALSAVGLFGLYDGLGAVAFAVLAAAIAIDLLARISQFARSLGLVLGTLVVAWLGLLGFNVLLELLLLSWLPVPKPSLEVGLILGVLVFAAVATRLLVLWHDRLAVAIVTGGILAVLNVAGLPLLVGSREPEKAVAAPQPMISDLDAIIVVPGRTGDRVAQDDAPAVFPGWRVRYAVARAGADERPEWLALGTDDAEVARTAALGSGPAVAGGPQPRPGADQLVLLDVDATPPVTPRPWELREVEATPGEIDHWLRIADGLKVAKDTPVVALLQTTDAKRLRRWDDALRGRGGFALSVQRRRARSLTDAALHAAIEAPTADEDLSLAVRFRPLMLFSSDAKAGNDRPLDVDALLSKGIVRLCHDDRIDGAERCNRVDSSAGLVNGATHLKIPREGTPVDVPSRIYVHPVRAGRLLYLDYWWYLLSNPNKVGLGGFCGAGLALPGLTCFKHDSDWEGVTVVVDVGGDEPVPVAVQYAQHSDVVRYSFQRLRDVTWLQPRIRSLLHAAGVKSVDTVDRPLVFVASGSHASYAVPCRADCRQLAKPDIGEDRHDGRSMPTWVGNDGNRCIADGCVRLVPTRAGGSKPALWNAYEGVWGERRCILISYCDAEVSPAAPASQTRYRRPSRITGYVDERDRFIACSGAAKQACPALPPASTRP
jgi:hypothetical protein